MAGFGLWLIPDQLRPAHQATLARGVRLSLAAAGQALSWHRLRVSWAQTLSKRPDLRRARKARTPWPPARPHLWPLRLSRVLTIIVVAASTAPLLMGEPASRAALDRIRWRLLRTDPMAVVISPARGFAAGEIAMRQSPCSRLGDHLSGWPCVCRTMLCGHDPPMADSGICQSLSIGALPKSPSPPISVSAQHPPHVPHVAQPHRSMPPSGGSIHPIGPAKSLGL